MILETTGLRVEHPRMTPQDLIKLSEQGEIIERSDHVGNQHTSALATMTDPRIRVRQILVDTTNGSDKEYRPRSIRLLGQSFSIAGSKHGSSCVAHIPAALNPDQAAIDELGVITAPTTADTVATYHRDNLTKVANGNSSIELLSDVMALTPDLAKTLMQVLNRRQLITRIVVDGKISEAAGIGPETAGIFGLLETGQDEGTRKNGAMLPLAGMMALDLAQASMRGLDIVHHQAGCDMRNYTRSEELMAVVASVALEALSDHVEGAVLPVYSVIDTTNLASLMAGGSAVVADSQYDEQLLTTIGAQPTQIPDSNLDKPLYTD